jgi:hypothetical protein
MKNFTVYPLPHLDLNRVGGHVCVLNIPEASVRRSCEMKTLLGCVHLENVSRCSSVLFAQHARLLWRDTRTGIVLIVTVAFSFRARARAHAHALIIANKNVLQHFTIHATFLSGLLYEIVNSWTV